VNILTTPTAHPELHFRALGHAYGLAALVTVIPSKPLYVSFDISAKVLDMSIQLLKRSGDHDVKLAQVEIEIAWTCISSLMTLGPNFVRTHLPQLLVLWRNALPKPTNKDTAADSGRTMSEWGFLLRVRESALGAIYCFLHYNSPILLTLDVARRIATMLSNAFLFVNAFSQFMEEPSSQAGEMLQTYASLRSREWLLKRRIFQCFSILGVSSVPDSTRAALLQSVISLVASPEGFSGSSVQAAITSSSGLFTSLWQTFDNYAYGVTSITTGENPGVTDPADDTQAGWSRLNRDAIESAVDELVRDGLPSSFRTYLTLHKLRRPILQSCEHDPLALCQAVNLDTDISWPEFPPSATQAVDAGLNLFAYLLPLQDVSGATRTITLLTDALRSPKLERNVGRKAAVRLNATMSVVLALRRVMANPTRNAREIFGNTQVSTALSSFLKVSASYPPFS
jgi:hypothetical protein